MRSTIGNIYASATERADALCFWAIRPLFVSPSGVVLFRTIYVKVSDGWPWPIFEVIEADKGKRLSSRYLHTYIFCYFHINTGDPYDETQREVQRWVTLTYISMSQMLIKEEVCYHSYFLHSFSVFCFRPSDSVYISTPTIRITSILIPMIHMMKPKGNFKDGWPWHIF